jgi:hypothetical protein
MTEVAFLARQRIEAQDTGTPFYVDGYYNNWRDDALSAISLLAPCDRSASLSIVAGTLSYATPAGFITMSSERRDARGYPVYRITTATGALLYVDEDFSLFAGQIVFAADPGVTATWTINYGGTYAITDVPDTWVKLALDHATASYYDARASAAGAFFNYSLGPDSVSKGPEAERWLKLRDVRMASFLANSSSIATRVSSMGTFRIYRA